MIKLIFLSILSISLYSGYWNSENTTDRFLASSSKINIKKEKKTGFTTIKKKDSISDMTQFVDKDGTVFAVTWEGKIPSALYATLGTNTKGTLGKAVKSRNIVIDRFRDGEKIKGRGYLLGALPKGVSAEELK